MRFSTLSVAVLTLLLNFLMASAFAQNAPKKTVAEYWSETDMSKEILLSPGRIDKESCAKSIDMFKACYYGVSQIAGFAAEPMSLVPLKLLNDPELQFPPLIKKIGPYFALVKIPQGEEKTVTEVRLARALSLKRQRKIDLALKQIRKALKPKETLDFPAYFSELEEISQIKASDYKMALAAAFDAFYQVADPHSHSMPKQMFHDQLKDASTEVIGIGAQINKVHKTFIIVSVFPGTPAELGGVLKNDVIEKVDGVPVSDKSLAEVIEKVRGQVDSKVVLTIRRSGWTDSFDLSFVRRKVPTPNVIFQTKNMFGRDYLIITLSTFMDERACDEIEFGLFRETTDNPTIAGLILDLRDNPGGLFTQAVCTGTLFIGPEVIVGVKDLRTGLFTTYNDFEKIKISSLPMVTLINAGSASSSEIVAGALQFYKRAWLVGETSYGKGSVQESRDLTGSVKQFRTISRFYQPSGFTNQGVGIVPDFTVARKVDATEDDRFAVRELDEFPNALPSEGKRFTTNRRDDLSRVQNCLDEERRSDALARSDSDEDYQILKAGEVLDCDAKTALINQNVVTKP